MIQRLRRAMVTRCVSNSAIASGLSTCLVRDTLCCWSSPKPLPALSPSLSALARVFADGLRDREDRLNDRYHPASLRDLSLFGESSARPWSEGPGLGIGGNPRHHAKTRPDGADRRLPQDARVADRRRHLLRQPVDHARTRAPASHPELLSRRP